VPKPSCQAAPQATDPSARRPALVGVLLDRAPDPIKQRLYDAFDIQILYRDDRQQATIWANITDTTSQAIQDLLPAPHQPPHPRRASGGVAV
jgi:hypothetical protein